MSSETSSASKSDEISSASRVETPMVYLVKNLQVSDMKAQAVPLTKVVKLLKKADPAKNEFYLEATNPGRKEGESREDSKVLNRVYVDVDGGCFKDDECPEQTDEWLDETHASILQAFADNISEPHSVMTATKRLPSGDIKLSYRITYTELCGTKAEVETYVLRVLLPLYKSYLDGVIQIDTKEKLYVKRRNPETKRMETRPPNFPHLVVDKSVYDVGRKMRCWNCEKDAKPENAGRPNVLEVGDPLDTLITYIPEECRRISLPTPPPSVSSASVRSEPAPAPRQMEELSVGTTETTGDPLPDEQPTEERNDLVKRLCEQLGDHRYDDYDSWIRIGFIFFNIGMTCADWDAVSKRSRKWKAGVCAEKWSHFKRGKLREATLWKWLKEDNPEAYDDLAKERGDFWSLLANPNNAEVAHFFYNLKPHAYLWHPDLAWYQLQASNIWLHFDREPAGLLNDIWETFRPLIREHIRMLDLTLNPDTPQGKTTQKRLKSALNFNRMSGDARFAKGVLDYLPYNYFVEDLPDKMDESKNLLAFADCVYDLEKGETRDIKPEDYICLHTGYCFPEKPSDEAYEEVFEFLRSMFETTEHIRSSTTLQPLTEYVLRVIADKMSGVRRFQDFYLMTGLGGNGKGLLRNIVARTFGRYYQEPSHHIITKTQEKQNSHNSEMALAKGKRILMATEPDASDAIQVSVVKAYTGNDVINARMPYGKKCVSYKAQFGLFLQCNMKPKLSKADGGVQRRLRVIKFPFCFKEASEMDADNPLHKPKCSVTEENTLRNDEWRSAFLHILLQVYKESVKGKESLNPPPEVLDASEEYMDENNPVKSWFKDNFRVGLPKDDMRFWIGATELHDAWDKRNPNRRISDSAFKNFVEIGCGQTQVKEKHSKKTKRYVEDGLGGANRLCFDGDGEWKDETLKPGKYWVGLLPVDAPHPDETATEVVAPVRLAPIFR